MVVPYTSMRRAWGETKTENTTFG